MKTKPKKKSFDCVDMMHKGALEIYRKTKGMTVEEEVAWWKKKSELFRKQRESKHHRKSLVP